MEKAKKPAYKYCIVQECKNSIRKTPDKLFFRLPNDAKIRKQWCKVMRKVYLSPKSCLYCCEDHFNVQVDTANYIEYNIKKQQGVKCSLRLKKGVVPHIFLCRKRNMPPPVVRMGLIKRQRLTLVNEALSEFAIKNSNVSKNGEPLQRSDHKVSPSTSHTNVFPESSTSLTVCDNHHAELCFSVLLSFVLNGEEKKDMATAFDNIIYSLISHLSDNACNLLVKRCKQYLILGICIG